METTTKVCIICKDEKFIGDFGINKKSKDGFKDICKFCVHHNKSLIEKHKEKNKSLYLKEKYNEKIIQLTIKKEKIELEKLQKKINKEKYKKENEVLVKKRIKDRKKLYKQNNKEIINKRKRERINSDPIFKLSIRLRKMLHYSFSAKGYVKNCKSQKILGCTFTELKIHLENKFEPWMNWNNHGIYTGNLNETWHIDHITPLSSAKSEDDIIRLNHYTNLQPLDSYINQVEKRNKINYYRENSHI